MFTALKHKHTEHTHEHMYKKKLPTTYSIEIGEGNKTNHIAFNLF